MKRICFTAALCLFVSEILADPRYGIRSWGIEEGLPSSRVTAIDQGKDGRLWLGTSRGLAAFDGIEFYNFNHVTNPELGGSDLTSVVISPVDSVWFSDRSGKVGYFDGNEFHAVKTALLDDDDFVASLAISPNGLVVAATRDGHLLELHPNQPSVIWKSNQWFELIRDFSPGLQTFFDGQGQLWAGLHTELNIWSSNGLIQVLPELHVDTSEDRAWVWAVGESPRQGVWIAADLQLRRYADGQWTEHRGEFPWGFDKGISSLLEARSGLLWVAATGGGLRGVPASGDPIVLAENDGLPTNDVLTLFEDLEANLWVGTDGGGLVRVRPELFERFEPGKANESDVRLDEIHVNSLVEDSTHDLWIATEGQGLLHWEGDGTHSVYDLDKPTATVLLHDSLGQVWCGTRQKGLDVFLSREQSLDVFQFESVDAFLGQTIVSLFEDSSRNVWVASDQALGRLSIENFQTPPTWPLGVMNDVRCILEDAEGRMWFGTADRGVFRWSDGKTHQFTMDDGLPDESVTAMCLDDEGKLWLGTYGGGIACFNGKRFEAIAQRDRLADGFVSGMVNDLAGSLWLGTGRGISRIAWGDLNRVIANKEGRVREMNFGREDGLAHLECSDGFYPSILRSELGKIYFPLKKGIAKLESAQIAGMAEWGPPVTIRQVEVDGDAASLDYQDGFSEVIITPVTRRIDIRFSGVGLSAPEKVVYRYRFADGEGDWVSIGSQRSVSFLELEPDNYRFEVSAALQGGPWNPVPAVLKLRVRPHWWETKTAVFSGGLGLLTIIGLVGWAYANRRIREAEGKRALDRAVGKERERIAQDMHDDLGARLTQLSFQGELLKRSLGEPKAVKTGLDEVVSGVRQTAQALDEIVWMTNPRNDQLDRLISHLAQLATEMADGVGWKLALSLPDSIPDCVVEGASRHEMVMAVKEVVNNASKHSGCQVLQFEVRIISGLLSLCIADDGCGFEVEQSEEKGNGLFQLKRRITSIGGEIRVISEPSKGTRVAFSIPLKTITM
jgi:signal transduction histidine kinase/ligand-binding sensor domain-containing protein